jgi:hypothetical protein
MYTEQTSDIQNIKDSMFSDRRKAMLIDAINHGVQIYVGNSMTGDDGMRHVCDVRFKTPLIHDELFPEDGAWFIVHFNKDFSGAWYCYASTESQIDDIPDSATYEDLVKELTRQANTCPKCHKVVGAKNMVHYGFAGYTCKDCHEQAYQNFVRSNGMNWAD